MRKIKIMLSTVAVIALTAMPTLAQTSRTPRTAEPMASDPILIPNPYSEQSYGPLYGGEAYGGEAFAAVPESSSSDDATKLWSGLWR